jgi:hypothetical protein
LKPEARQITFNISVRTAKKTQHFAIKKINLLTLFKEIIADYSELHGTPNALCGQCVQLLSIKAGGTHSYRWVLNG